MERDQLVCQHTFRDVKLEEQGDLVLYERRFYRRAKLRCATHSWWRGWTHWWRVSSPGEPLPTQETIPLTAVEGVQCHKGCSYHAA